MGAKFVYIYIFEKFSMKRAKEKRKEKGIDILNLIGTSQEKA